MWHFTEMKPRRRNVDKITLTIQCLHQGDSGKQFYLLSVLCNRECQGCLKRTNLNQLSDFCAAGSSNSSCNVNMCSLRNALCQNPEN